LQSEETQGAGRKESIINGRWQRVIRGTGNPRLDYQGTGGSGNPNTRHMTQDTGYRLHDTHRQARGKQVVDSYRVLGKRVAWTVYERGIKASLPDGSQGAGMDAPR
jgi:hypothetical protein